MRQLYGQVEDSSNHSPILSQLYQSGKGIKGSKLAAYLGLHTLDMSAF